MSYDSWLILAVAVTAVAFLTQAVALFLIATRVRSASQQVSEATDQIRRRVDVVLEAATGLIGSLGPVAQIAQTISSNAGAITTTARRLTDDIDAFAKEATQSAKAQLAKLDFVVTDTAQKFEKTTSILQREVLTPVVEVTSIVQGIRSGIDYLLSRRAETRERRYPEEEEEMFI